MKNVVIKQGKELQELMKQNEHLEQGSAACRIVLRELSENITTLSNANDDQRIELENFTKRKENSMLRVYGKKQKNEIQRELYVEPLDGSRRQLANRFY